MLTANVSKIMKNILTKVTFIFNVVLESGILFVMAPFCKIKKGSSIMYLRSDFIISDSPFFPCSYAFGLQPLPPSANVRILFFKEDKADTYFVNYHQSK